MKQSLLQELKQTIRNPLVVLSLILGILGAAPLWFSGILLGDHPLLAGALFCIYILICSTDAVVTLTLLIGRNK